MTWLRLGELLMHQTLCTREQLLAAWEEKVRFGDRLGTNLLAIGALDEESLARALGQQHQVPSAYGSVINVEQEVANLVDATTADKLECIPHHIEGDVLYLLVTDPTLNEHFLAMGKHLGKQIAPVVICEARCWQLLYKIYGVSRAMRAIDLDAPALSPSSGELTSEAEFHAMYSNRDTKGIVPGLSDEGEAIDIDIDIDVDDPPSLTDIPVGAPVSAPAAQVVVAAPQAPLVVGELAPPLAASTPLVAAPPAAAAPPVVAASAPIVAASTPVTAAPTTPKPRFRVVHTTRTTERIETTEMPQRAPWAAMSAFAERARKQQSTGTQLVPPKLEPPKPNTDAPPTKAAHSVEPEHALKHTLFMPAVSLSDVPTHNPSEHSSGEVARPSPHDENSPLTLVSAIAAFSGAVRREEIADVALRYLRSSFERAAILNVRPSTVKGWRALGDDEDFTHTHIASYSAPLGERSLFTHVIETKEIHVGELQPWKENGGWVKATGRKIPKTVIAAPVILEGKVMNVLYADNGHGQETTLGERHALEELCTHMALAYSNLMKAFSFS